jgi:hypothetical protein
VELFPRWRAARDRRSTTTIVPFRNGSEIHFGRIGESEIAGLDRYDRATLTNRSLGFWVMEAAQADMGRAILACAQTHLIQGEVLTHLVMSPRARDQLLRLIADRGMLTEETDLGRESRFMGFDVLVDHRCPDDTAYFLNLDRVEPLYLRGMSGTSRAAQIAEVRQEERENRRNGIYMDARRFGRSYLTGMQTLQREYNASGARISRESVEWIQDCLAEQMWRYGVFEELPPKQSAESQKIVDEAVQEMLAALDKHPELLNHGVHVQ